MSEDQEVQVSFRHASSEETARLLEALFAPIPEDEEILIPIIVYPINGRATNVSPIQHWCHDGQRDLCIEWFYEELRREESREDLGLFLKLMETHDTVRVGRIVCHILRMKHGIPCEGVEVMELP
jgi:hypothetical protein